MVKFEINEETAGWVGGIIVAVSTGYTIYKFVDKKFYNRPLAIVAGILSGIGFGVSPIPIKLAGMAASTALLAHTV